MFLRLDGLSRWRNPDPVRGIQLFGLRAAVIAAPVWSAGDSRGEQSHRSPGAVHGPRNPAFLKGYRQGKALDWHYIEANLEPLVEAEGEPEILTVLHKLRRSV